MSGITIEGDFKKERKVVDLSKYDLEDVDLICLQHVTVCGLLSEIITKCKKLQTLILIDSCYDDSCLTIDSDSLELAIIENCYGNLGYSSVCLKNYPKLSELKLTDMGCMDIKGDHYIRDVILDDVFNDDLFKHANVGNLIINGMHIDRKFALWQRFSKHALRK